MWRSLLFMPVLEERFLAKAAERGADAVVLDLEASIVAARKDEARAALAPAVERLHAAGQDVLVRINMPWRPALKDLEFAVRPGVRALALPGCESAAHVLAVDACVGELEAERGLPHGGIRLVPLIESPRGVRDADAILRATGRIACVGFGIEDYLAILGAPPSVDLQTMTGLAVAEAARAAGVVPLIVPETLGNLEDMDSFEAAAERGRRMGSEGGFAAHPGQVERLNKVFTPSDEEVATAERIVATAREAERAGLGAVRHEGGMIDGPIIVRSERLLERARRYR